MQTRTCPLCGLEPPDLDEHTRRTHGASEEAVELLVKDGKRRTAQTTVRQLEDRFGFTAIDLARGREEPAADPDEPTPEERKARPAMRRGGYL